MVPGRPQTCYHTAPLSGTSIASTSPNHYPAPRLVDPASGQASPAQLCVIQPRPGWHKFTLHPHHPLHPHPSHHNPSHHLSLDGWRLGTDDRLVASVLATAICLLSPRKAGGTVACICQADQLALPRAVVSKNAAPCRKILTHCHRAVQRDWSGPFSQSSQVWRRPGPLIAPLALFSPL